MAESKIMFFFFFLLFRYLFESDHKKFFPTICLENGPIDLGIMWPEAAVVVPRFDEVSFFCRAQLFKTNKVVTIFIWL